jgi:hypothetical protein
LTIQLSGRITSSVSSDTKSSPFSPAYSIIHRSTGCRIGMAAAVSSPDAGNHAVIRNRFRNAAKDVIQPRLPGNPVGTEGTALDLCFPAGSRLKKWESENA